MSTLERFSKRIAQSAMGTWFYHVTPERNLEAIMSEGLMPNKSGSGYGKGSVPAIYLAGSSKTAKWYKIPNEPCVLLKINGVALHDNKLKMDDDAYSQLEEHEFNEENDKDWRRSLTMTDQVRYEDVIPPSAIKVMHRV